MINYKEYYIAFLDILGFSRAIPHRKRCQIPPSVI